MTHTFYLKDSQGQNPKKGKVKQIIPANSQIESLILFSCYFKNENKKFVYSTGEKIKPIHWNFEENRPKLKGSVKNPDATTINSQLGRYSDAFAFAESECKRMNEEFTSKLLKMAFNDTFKKTSTKKDLFFVAYEEFMKEKQLLREWKPATVKRYTNIKNHLEGFEKEKKFKLTFSKINDRFYPEFTDYCYTTLGHNTNTFSRNVGLFKTFMFWAKKKNYTYNTLFTEFKKPERIITKEVALTLEQVQAIFEHQAANKSLERVKDVFVFQCLTGLRYGELKLISERNVENDTLCLKEEKDVSKDEREIPLFTISKYILKKYDYQLPLLSNQKQNEFIKEVVSAVGYTNEVEYTRTQNNEQTTIVKPFFKRISTHTARRSFITIMKKKGIADKTIMSMTGHRDVKTFNTYYKVDNIARQDAMKLAFGKMSLPKLKSV